MAGGPSSFLIWQADPPLSRPGTWAYPDMLEVGRLANATEDRSHFGAWAISSSPLILGFDMADNRTMGRVWPIITNREVIQVNQAWAGHPGAEIHSEITYKAWAKPLGSHPLGSHSAGSHSVGSALAGSHRHQVGSHQVGSARETGSVASHALFILSNSSDPISVSVPLAHVIPSYSPSGSRVTARDLYAHADLGAVQGVFVAQLMPHDSLMVRLDVAAAAQVDMS